VEGKPQHRLPQPSNAKTAAHAGKEFGSVFLFFRFFVLDVYNVTGERIHIDLRDVF
jgi:hypothetical protein